MSSSSLTAAALAYQTAESNYSTAKDSLVDAKDAIARAMAELVIAALSAENQEIREASEGIGYCHSEIETKTSAEETGLRAQKAQHKLLTKALRTAARTGGDVQGAEASLAEIEDTIDNLAGEIRDLRRRLKEHEANLIKLVGGIA